jgi:hypothetical protein
MKFPLAQALSLLALLCAGFFPAHSRAAETHDCTEGCYIITCNESVCVAWFCDSRGCRMMNGWAREQSQGPQSKGRKDKPHVEIAYAKVCPAGKDCEVYELSPSQALHLGSFDNINDLLRYREPVRRENDAPRK